MAIVDLATKQSAYYIRPSSWADVSIIFNPPHAAKLSLTGVVVSIGSPRNCRSFCGRESYLPLLCDISDPAVFRGNGKLYFISATIL